VATYRTSVDSLPVFVVAGGSNTTNVEGFFKFLIDCAKDPRFNADNIMHEIQLVTKLDLIDQALYRFLVIPITKKRLLEREAQFKWIYRNDFPEWGRGRDDAMNLTKYFMVKQPMDDTFGPTDMPSVWNLRKYRPEKGMFGRQPRRLFGDHGFGAGASRRAAQGQGRVRGPREMAA
jgi:hypothetical protein